jgi:signal transduction histidine kinase
MMSAFLANNHDELVRRCKDKVALRPRREATAEQLSNGVPLFLAQLRRTLEAEEGHGGGDTAESVMISGTPGSSSLVVSEMGVSATAHGRQLLNLGFSVDQVVHDYGDLCQAITDLAFERDAPFSIDEFRTLNRCLDNAIASAVSAFSLQRDAQIARKQDADVNERVAVLMHELRNSLATASYAMAALEQGNLPVSGSTGTVLKRSLTALTTLVNRSLAEARTEAEEIRARATFTLLSLVTEAKNDALLYARTAGLQFVVAPVASDIEVSGDHGRLLAAIGTLLQNAFKYTQKDTEVLLSTRVAGDRILIEVQDHCGGLGHGYATTLFKPYSERKNGGKRGLGLGLSIARANVEADGGLLTVEDQPGVGCIFTISLPRYN